MTLAALLLLSFFAVLLFIHVLLLAWLMYAKRSEKNQNRMFSPQQYLIIYASQSGQAEQYAQHTALQLQQAGIGAACVNIQDIRAEHLQQASRVLWMVSTYGEGDAPDTAQAFQQQVLKQSYDLSQMSYAILAFGDRRYANFCHFGQELHAWLQKQHAQPCFDLVCVNQLSTADLDSWSHHLEQLTNVQLQLDHAKKHWLDFALQDRTVLNTGSCGSPMYSIALSAAGQQWQSGDILEVQCANSDADIQRFLAQFDVAADQALTAALKQKNLRLAPARLAEESPVQWAARFEQLPVRDYSIASIPAQKQLHLVVRQQMTDDGLGIGSGWLTAHAEVGENIRANLRCNPSFHLVQSDQPMIFIGNGSGIAGLMAHVQQREAWGFKQNWLIFGERQQQFDFLFQDKLQEWQHSGLLSELDTVFSRDHAHKRYVQHVLLEKSEQLRSWVEQGACIYLCGSLKGMAQGVDDALREILGEAKFEQLRLKQRYRRDVY